MQIYVDSANIKEIQHAAAMGFISGVTTNPSLLAKEDPSTDIRALIKNIHATVGGHTSVEVISTDTDGMLREAGVVAMRFGLTDGQPKTLDEIGKVYGVTRERIRQIESKTMSKLRHPSRSQVLRDYLD